MKVNEELWKKFLYHNNAIECTTDEEFQKAKDYILNKSFNWGIPLKCLTSCVIGNESKTHYILPNDSGTDGTILYSELFIEDEIPTEDKEYSASELIHMMEEGKLNDNDIIITNAGFKYSIKTEKNALISSLLELAPYKIKKYEPKYVTFEEAIKSGKRIKYKNWDSYSELKDIIIYGLIMTNPTIAKKIINEKAWLIEEN